MMGRVWLVYNPLIQIKKNKIKNYLNGEIEMIQKLGPITPVTGNMAIEVIEMI